MITSHTIRQRFLDYFCRHDHRVIPSSPLVPANDPTLLFTNAGMVQFKDVFLGLDERPSPRAVSSQRCVRAGGKHNDLENVGYTARHHTFFEMLGNFSFGDYFKAEAIHYAWDFLTNELKIPAARLWVSVYRDDDEAARIWLHDIGMDESRFARLGDADNFWAMGETGPCGPCSEIFYDHGTALAGGPPGSKAQPGERYVEIWNLVFMQYARDANGCLHPIPKPCVDTGMGLERIAAVMQGVDNNYETDSFQHLIQAITNLAGRSGLELTSLRVLADHIRAAAFLITDGVIPSNERQGYVLRRIIRRAARHGHKLGFDGPFFYRLVEPLEGLMGAVFPELTAAYDRVEATIKQEEERFAQTLNLGLRHFEEMIAGLSGKLIAGEDAFKLYDTYGFPVDLTADIARERGLQVDEAGFDKAMAGQRQRAREASRFEMSANLTLPTPELEANAIAIPPSDFIGYDKLQHTAEVSALWRDGQTVNELKPGESGAVLLDATPFYAESGGQVGDQGQLLADGTVFDVEDTRKHGKAHVHTGTLQHGRLHIGQQVTARVDHQHRQQTVCNHSATHLLHAALRQVLGAHVTQKGSLVAPDRLRFDFAHPRPVSTEQVRQLEHLVNRKIYDNAETHIAVMPLAAALESGAMSLFGEKYDADVRVLSIADKFSVELCGGTHVVRAGDIGLFKIIAETGIAAGVRRIEALTGEAALQFVLENEAKLNQLARLLKTDRDHALPRLQLLLDHSHQQERELSQLKSRLASNTGDELLGQAADVAGIQVLAIRLKGVDPKSLRAILDHVKNKLGTAAVVLAAVAGSKVSLVAGVTQDTTDRITAGELVNFVARKIGGKGGGRADMAQAGGNQPDKLPGALAAVPGWIRQQVTQGTE